MKERDLFENINLIPYWLIKRFLISLQGPIPEGVESSLNFICLDYQTRKSFEHPPKVFDFNKKKLGKTRTKGDLI